MSFASDTKNELARIEPEKKCCMLAEISGFLRVAGSIGLVGLGKFRIKITTENPEKPSTRPLRQDIFVLGLLRPHADPTQDRHHMTASSPCGLYAVKR